MEKQDRLTRRNSDGDVTLIDEDSLPMVRLTERVSAALEKLASYEDAEEQGRLVRLPVKIGQKVYIVMNLSVGIEPWIEETTVCAVTFKDSHYPRYVWSFSTETTEPFHKSDIGKRVFLTHAEAEAALQALEAGR